MSSRRQGNGVRGPNSALTEFLQERGINPAAIRSRALARAEAAELGRAEAAQIPPRRGQEARGGGGVAAVSGSASSSAVADPTTATRAAEAKGKAKGKTKGKGKAAGKGKAHGKKRKRGGSDGDSDSADNDDDDYDADADWDAKPTPAPGQIAFCAACDGRFTVTIYSKPSEDGDGLLCSPCGRKMAKQQDGAEVRKKRQPAVRRAKREALCLAMDGEVAGPKSLKEYCIRLVAKYIDDVEALGDLSSRDMDRICGIISRNRSLNNHTLGLFLEPHQDSLNLYDCARIDASELCSVGARVGGLKHLSLHHAGRMTDQVLCSFADNLPLLESLHLDGAFLVGREAYIRFLDAAGARLRALTLAATARVGHDVVAAIVRACPNLHSLRLAHLPRLDDGCVALLRRCRQLTGLDLSHAGGPIAADTVAGLLAVLGPGLEELRLAGLDCVSRPCTAAISQHCARLRVLDLSDCAQLAGADLEALFGSWQANDGLRELYLARLADLTPPALRLAAAHSGPRLRVLDLSSCRGAGVDKASLLAVLAVCRRLQRFDAAFVRDLDDDVVEAMQAVGIKRLSVWGCTRVTEACAAAADVAIVGREADIVAH